MSIIEKAIDRLGRGVRAQSGVATATVRRPVPVDEPGAEAVIAVAAAPVVAEPAPAPKPAPAPRTVRATHRIDIDMAGLRGRGFVTPDAERTQIGEQFRLVKRPLLANAFGGESVPEGNVIMVTSALPGEGKTFCAVNLAMSIAAERDRTVLLVDADVARPSVPQMLGFECDRGLLDLLLDDKLDMSEVLLRTNIENLAILPAGRKYRQSTELLASEAMNTIIREMSHRYPDRLILFDSPPLLATSESHVLASHMGQILMVVEEGATPRDAIKEALSRIEGSPAVGLLLNKGRGERTPSYGDFYGD